MGAALSNIKGHDLSFLHMDERGLSELTDMKMLGTGYGPQRTESKRWKVFPLLIGNKEPAPGMEAGSRYLDSPLQQGLWERLEGALVELRNTTSTLS